MQSHEDDSFVIGIGCDIVTLDDNLLERIANLPERIQFLVFLDFIGQGIGRLDIILVNAVGDDEINLVLDIYRSASGLRGNSLMSAIEGKEVKFF